MRRRAGRFLLGVLGAVRLAGPRGGPVDLSRVDRLPERLVWPLGRDGFDPVPRLAGLRDEQPVARLTSFLGIDVWLVTGAEEARTVLAASADFSTDIRPYVGQAGDPATGSIGGLGFTDPPDHTRLRRLLAPEFTMRRLARLQPRITAIVEDQLDALSAASGAGESGGVEPGAGESGGVEPGVVDLVRDFAFPVPFLVICELLGLPAEERETLRSLAAARFDVTQGGRGALGAISGSRAHLLDFTRRQRLDPGDGLVGQLVREHGEELTDVELAGLADGAFTGGLETSASMLALGTAVLLSHRDHYRRLAEEPDLVEPTVEELLRHLSVVQVAFPRFAKADVEVAGRRIRAGDVVMCHLAAAGRDGRAGAGDELDLERDHRVAHLAFGHGLHRCVGAELARMELRTAYPALARRFPQLQVGTDRLAFRRRSIVYGLESLPVRLGVDALSTTP